MKIVEKNIDKDEITSLLTQDTYYRKIGTWPLFMTKDIISKRELLPSTERLSLDNDVQKITTEYFLVSRMYEHNKLLINNSLEKFTSNINEKHPFTTELLIKFSGNIVACGGSVAKNLMSNPPNIYYNSINDEDIDLFFYNLDNENASKLRIEIALFLINKWKNKNDKIKIRILRNEFVTTIYFIEKRDEYYSKIHSYQLIHRIYPNISSIIGGFDINVCMVAYDGNEIYATPLGTWALKNHTIIIDTKRRSTSFEYRICKYYNFGFNILFPGLTQEIVNDLVINPCRSSTTEIELLSKLHTLAKEHNYHLHHVHMIKNHTNDILFIDQQKKENVLPFLNINDGNNDWRRNWEDEVEYESCQEIKIGILPYNLKSIENRHINKISDYSHNSIDMKFLPHINTTRLRLDNLASVVSVLKVKGNIDYQILLDEANNPDLKFTPHELKNYISRTEEARKFYGSDWNTDNNLFDKELFIRKDTYRLTKCFGKLALEVSEVRNTDKYYDYVNIMIEKIINNAKICKENLTGIKWITKNPGRQWTSSINPIIANSREWYGKHYIPVLTGIPEEIETILRLMRLERTESVWVQLPNDIFTLILQNIMKTYADIAWKYI